MAIKRSGILRDSAIFIMGVLASYFVIPTNNSTLIIPQNYQETRSIISFSIKHTGWQGYVECVEGEKLIYIKDFYTGEISPLEDALLNIPELGKRDSGREMVMDAIEPFECPDKYF